MDPWFCGLPKDDKLFWIYLLDNCDHAGIWQVNWPLVRFYMGEYTFKKDVFNGRIIELSTEKWFIPKFIAFQYGELNEENRAHLSVINILKKEGAMKGLTSPSLGDTYTDKDKDKDKEKDINNIYIGDFVKMSKKHHLSLIDSFGPSIVATYIRRLNNYIGSKGKKYKSHYHTILVWADKDGIKKLKKVEPIKETPKDEIYCPGKIKEITQSAIPGVK